ncbi:NucA/NucB deoxyribonuclease domain-containing protein [Streptomyces anandii]|uniref:NucA/NucB deoxyribonuclease domain-containing protein n=1 Tax=Streptomyces anandii TaxID=285454 RepID=UPI0037B9B4D6
MSERVVSGRTDGLITLSAADALWVDLTADSAVPTASGAFTRSPARVGYVLLGSHVVATVRVSGCQWSVPEDEVRRAAAELNAVGMDRQDLVRIGPFRGAPRQECDEETPLRWRRRITGELQELGGPERAVRREVGRQYHLAGIDWRQMLVEQTRDGTQRTWWLPRAVVRLLDAAEHAEAQWVRAARTRQASAAATEPSSHPRQAQAADGRQTTSPEGPTASLRPYNKELEGRLYSVLSRKPGTSRRVAGWACAVCRTAPATVLDHCHEHGYVRAPVCQSCNTPYDLILRDKKGTEAIGRLWFDMWTLGFAYDGSRRVDYVASVENIRVQTAGTEDATKWSIAQSFRHSIDASSSDPNPQVTDPSTVQRDELLGAWDKKPTWTLTYTSPDLGAQYNNGNQQKVAATVFMDLDISSPSVSPYQEVDAYHSAVRFDYAGPVAGKFMGTVFTGARVELVMSRKDAAVKESALHIYDALERPERTFPSFAGKTVPGEKEPLHRMIDKDKQAANRAKSISECKKVWGDYSGTGLECDEYPFASTKEGSTKGDNRFSVRLITGTDNRAGGNRLDAMYTLNRVLDGDAFYMKITD